jgi:hypothetical protein
MVSELGYHVTVVRPGYVLIAGVECLDERHPHPQYALTYPHTPTPAVSLGHFIRLYLP